MLCFVLILSTNYCPVIVLDKADNILKIDTKTWGRFLQFHTLKLHFVQSHAFCESHITHQTFRQRIDAVIDNDLGMKNALYDLSMHIG